MTKMDKTAADMIAIYFAGIAKTAAELRDAIAHLNATIFGGALNVEVIARDNEGKQGIKMF
jgi:hypothetical protein